MNSFAVGSNVAIDVSDVTKTYVLGDVKVEALRGVTFTIRRGEYVAIMGPSGSGKSTLMNLLGCLDRPTSGTYLLDGIDVSTLGDDQLAAIRLKKLGFVFQGFNLLARTSALKNVALPLFYAGLGSRARNAAAAAQLTEVGLGDRLDHKPSELSGGQQQRVAIARALVNDPAVLLADEPTGNLDTQTSEEIMALFQQLNAGGRTVIMVTHDEDVAGHAKRIIRLRDGRIVSDEVSAATA
jgi:putative ABC transport system ATP-binding protein